MPNDRARYQEAMRTGLAHNASRQYQQAIRAFRIAAAEYPTQPAPYAGLGDALLALKLLPKALESYKHAARFSGGRFDHLCQVADVQERLGHLAEASRTYMAAGELLLRQRRLDEAVGNWERAIRLDPNLLGAHQRLAMVFQRQNNVKGAVREYLAITRILQEQGQQQKALAMGQAAARLDPGNPDVLMAMRLVRHGESALPEPPDPPVAAPPVLEIPADTLAEAVRQMATFLEAESGNSRQAAANPLEAARRRAQDELAEEIFRDEDDQEALYGTRANGLSKLERDALIGQGMDFQQRGRLDEAIGCYEQAIRGGLRLPGAFFTLGLLYLEQRQLEPAKRLLAHAARDDAYRAGIQHAVTHYR